MPRSETPISDPTGRPGGAAFALDHPTLAVAVANRLRELIESRVLPPGERLNERALCEQMNVSRTPLREAFRILAAEGLIVVLPKRGARVVQLSDADVENIFDLLAVVEGLSARLAAERAPQAELDRIAAQHREMVAAFEAGDMQRYAIVSKSIHVAINAAAGNAILTETYLRLNGQVQSLRFQSNLEGDAWRHSVDDHEGFVRALLAREAARAESLLRTHLLSKKAFAMRSRFAQAAGVAAPGAPIDAI
jgi:DNA-binding GntR family transcriptional regulator